MIFHSFQNIAQLFGQKKYKKDLFETTGGGLCISLFRNNPNIVLWENPYRENKELTTKKEILMQWKSYKE